MPRPIVWRGAGLGNEIFPWAKAYIASRELGFRLLRPAWGLNRRNYRQEFGTSRLDFLQHATLRLAMPVVTVTDELVQSTGETDYGAAMRVLDAEYGWSRRRSIILLHQGMAGGHLAIERARGYLRNTLLGRLPERGCPDDCGPDKGQLRVAMHIRLGDFSQDSTGPQPGVFNRRLPLSWYLSVLETLQERYSDSLHIDLVSDDPLQAAQMLSGWRTCDARSRSILEDLSIMATADLLVCSVSAFSMLAAFLSDAPYLWYRPHLHEYGDFLSISGYKSQQMSGGTGENLKKERRIGCDALPTRGVAVDSSGELPHWLTDFLTTKAALNRRSADLVRCGVVPRHSSVPVSEPLSS
ncbi:hypothetical protein [Streptomyces sp. NPDC052107]|uniref:hypothetical protein n=1 Tax=Streptomyces sp. NPDC052107 TaxID=3155632 RepID=UPI0034159953